ncbi:MAG: hypothetical protein CM1200mP30_05630 [Pseudomonadota bacterium]|nr:MAG: hypothetical protein CM1200mP30_05630 [Pseudomonadota bacterium]
MQIKNKRKIEVIKTSPLSGIYRNHPVNTIEVSEWHIAGNFGDTEREQENPKKGASSSTGPHIGKISFLGGMHHPPRKRP